MGSGGSNVGSGEVMCVEWGSGRWGSDECKAGEWEVGKKKAREFYGPFSTHTEGNELFPSLPKFAHQVSMGRVVVLHGGKAGQTILVDVHSQGITRGHQHIDTQIKLEPIQDEWLREKGIRIEYMDCTVLVLFTAVS